MKRFAFNRTSLIALSCWLFALPALAQIFLPIPPAVRIISPPNHATFYAPVDIPIFAYSRAMYSWSYTNLYGSLTNLEFYANSIDLGPGHRVTKAGPPFSPYIIVQPNEFELVWSDAPAGAFALTAVGTDNRGRSATSAPVNITILSSTNGTNRPNIVSIVASDPIAIEGTNCWRWIGLTNPTPIWPAWPPTAYRFFTNCGPKNATFTVRRFGDATDSLTVNYAIGGTASNGVDYAHLSGVVTIPAGEGVAMINIVPNDDGPPDINKTVVLTLTPSASAPPDYVVGFPSRAAAIIVDSSLPHPPTAMLPGAIFHLSASGPDGAWFSVEYTTDLQNWTPLCTNQVVNGAIDFVDPDAANDPSRYYRAVPQAGP